jgi:hypothetical protein
MDPRQETEDFHTIVDGNLFPEVGGSTRMAYALRANLGSDMSLVRLVRKAVKISQILCE